MYIKGKIAVDAHLHLLLKIFYSVTSQNIYSRSDKEGYVYTIGGSGGGGELRGSHPPPFK